MPQYCLVKHRISTYVIDGDDADRNPDRVPVTGTVTFEALLDKGDSVVVTEDGVATTITLAAIEARITNGEIYHRGEEGVKLFAGGPDTNPERIRYRAKFSNLIAGGKKIELKDILFEAIPGGELTLSMAQPVPGKPYPGYSATIEQGITQIEGARDEALGQVEGAVDNAIESRVAPLENAIEETRGSRIFWESPPGSGLYEIGFKDTLNPRHDGLVLYDTFSRVESDLVGSLPDVGDAWAGTAGSWSADGGMARSIAPGKISTDAKSKSLKFSIALHTVSTGSLQTLRIYAGGTTDQPDFGVMLIVNVASYATLTITPYWASPSLAQFGEPLSAHPPEGPGTPLDVTVDIDISDRDVTITLTGPSGTVSTTGTIPTDLQAQMGTWATILSMTQIPGVAVDSVEITTAPYPQIGQ